MAPKRFKAVCTETGREFGAAGLYYSGVEYDKWDNPVGQTWSINFEDENEDPTETDVSKVELCQSTGLTDSRGAEVFEGDVLACKCHADIAVVWVQGSEPEDPVAAWGWKYAHPDFDHVEYHNTFQRSGICLGRSVIGNKWMPAAELRARAEAVSNEL